MTPPRGGRPAPFAEINITPLTDVMLVLLVIFMVASPYLDPSSLELDLPKAEMAEAAGGGADGEEPLRITVTRSGEILLEGRAVAAGSLPVLLARASAEALLLRCDAASPCQPLVTVVDAARTGFRGRVELEVAPEAAP